MMHSNMMNGTNLKPRDKSQTDTKGHMLHGAISLKFWKKQH